MVATVTSSRDERIVGRRGAAPSYRGSIPNGVDVDLFPAAPSTEKVEPLTLLFLRAPINYYPNTDGRAVLRAGDSFPPPAGEVQGVEVSDRGSRRSGAGHGT